MTDEINNPFDAIRAAVSRAKLLNRAADDAACDMAALLQGRLRRVNGWKSTDILRALKRELRDFNMTTGKWDEP